MLFSAHSAYPAGHYFARAVARCELHPDAAKALLESLHPRGGSVRAERAGRHVEVASAGARGLPQGARDRGQHSADVLAREAQAPDIQLRGRVAADASTRAHCKAGTAARRGGAHAAVRRPACHAVLAVVVPRFWHR
ncbi:hypothetical protein ON010_g16893 [Phytophthora cinnamomi]|nr:hypothetical protein ON010_g16893 [Phytophthora cinnamomi]